MCEFEKKVWNSLIENGAFPAHSRPFELSEADTQCFPRLGLAVSGGADSISLLLAISAIIPPQAPLYVITVNHNIRPEAESRGDADFVVEVCKKLRSDKIVCQVVELARGQVEACAAERGAGIEEAARFLRYQAFESFAKEKKLDALCLAHNKNDQLETLLMRFLQGSPAEAAAGIRARRELSFEGVAGDNAVTGGNAVTGDVVVAGDDAVVGGVAGGVAGAVAGPEKVAGAGPCFYLRPLLGLSRQEIEEYVTGRGFSWRTDKTNYETDYLRNKIRLKLIPFLDNEFPGWQRAVLSGAEKAFEDAAFIQAFLERERGALKFLETEGAGVELSLEALLKAAPALQYRLLLEACNRAGQLSRIPHQFLRDLLSSLQKASKGSGGGSFFKHFDGIDIICEKNHLFIKKHCEDNTDLVFSDIIEKTGSFEFPFGILDVFNYRELEGRAFVSLSIAGTSIVDGISLPFCVRSVRPGDTILAADGSEKKVSDILSDWHVAASKRNLIPVIQLLDEKAQSIKALLGGFLGYKDWIVKL